MDEQAEATLKVGDVVQLRSGGPAMTVAYDGECVWFEGGECRSHKFPVALLRPYVPDPSGAQTPGAR